MFRGRLGTVTAPVAMTHRRRTRPRWIALVVVVAAGVVVVGWFIAREARFRYRPETGPRERLGIDVSHYQGSIDWEVVAGDGITFAYIKSTEAGDWVDDTFAVNWAGARRAGIDVGAYHFFTLCRTGEDQAANLLATVPVDEADLPFTVDLEFANNCADRPPRGQFQHELADFLGLVEDATGQAVLLYVEDEFDEMYDVLGTFGQPTWERSLRARPSDDRWVIWQASDTARISGIAGGVDLDLMSADCCGERA